MLTLSADEQSAQSNGQAPAADRYISHLYNTRDAGRDQGGGGETKGDGIL